MNDRQFDAFIYRVLTFCAIKIMMPSFDTCVAVKLFCANFHYNDVSSIAGSN